jgi:dTDP-glucose 4,6-dehydratase
MNKKILITGSCGFLGTIVVDYFLEHTRWDIIGVDSFKHKGDSCRYHQNTKRYRVYTHDLTTPISETLKKKIGNVDIVLNLASESHVDRSINDFISFVKNNVDLMLNVLQYSLEIKPDMLIHCSTDEVYGSVLEGQSHTEWSTILPSNPYAASKAAQEALCISAWRTYGIPLIITNSMNFIGKRQDKEKYLPKLISKVYNNEIITVHRNNDIIGSRFYVPARNYADALIFLINRNEVTRWYGSNKEIIIPDRYNIVGDTEVNNLELAEIVSDIMGKPLKYEFVDFNSVRPGHDAFYRLNGDKLEKLGWCPPVTFESELKEIIRWTIENPEWM